LKEKENKISYANEEVLKKYERVLNGLNIEDLNFIKKLRKI